MLSALIKRSTLITGKYIKQLLHRNIPITLYIDIAIHLYTFQE